MTWQTLIESIAGGALIGLAVSIMLIFNGRVTGVSGITNGTLSVHNIKNGDYLWRLAFLVGLVLGGVLLLVFYEPAFDWEISADLGMIGLAGFLVGFGALMGSGCTSGHGICGISRLSPRSIVATLSFMSAGFITVYIIRHVIGG